MCSKFDPPWFFHFLALSISQKGPQPIQSISTDQKCSLFSLKINFDAKLRVCSMLLSAAILLTKEGTVPKDQARQQLHTEKERVFHTNVHREWVPAKVDECGCVGIICKLPPNKRVSGHARNCSPIGSCTHCDFQCSLSCSTTHWILFIFANKFGTKCTRFWWNGSYCDPRIVGARGILKLFLNMLPCSF